MRSATLHARQAAQKRSRPPAVNKCRRNKPLHVSGYGSSPLAPPPRLAMIHGRRRRPTYALSCRYEILEPDRIVPVPPMLMGCSPNGTEADQEPPARPSAAVKLGRVGRLWITFFARCEIQTVAALTAQTVASAPASPRSARPGTQAPPGKISAPMLAAIRAADSFTESSARCAYLAVV